MDKFFKGAAAAVFPMSFLTLRRLDEPHILKAVLHGMCDCYKIKRGPFRLVYQVLDESRVKLLAVGHRNRLAAYEAADDRAN